MDKEPTYEDASEVKEVDGSFEVDGPDSVDVTLTPEAAGETSERLIEEAVRARGQRRLNRFTHRAQD